MKIFIGRHFSSKSLFSYQVDMEFEKTGNKKCMQEFLAKESMNCIVMVKSGLLKMSGCILSLDGIFKEIHRKVPSIAVL